MRDEKVLTNEDVASWPETAQLRALPRGSEMNVLIDWLAGRSRRKNILASRTLVYLGKHPEARDNVVSRLAQEVGTGRSECKRLRILDVIEEIGSPLGVGEFFDLMHGLRPKSPNVRSRIIHVTSGLSHA